MTYRGMMEGWYEDEFGIIYGESDEYYDEEFIED